MLECINDTNTANCMPTKRILLHGVFSTATNFGKMQLEHRLRPLLEQGAKA